MIWNDPDIGTELVLLDHHGAGHFVYFGYAIGGLKWAHAVCARQKDDFYQIHAATHTQTYASPRSKARQRTDDQVFAGGSVSSCLKEGKAQIVPSCRTESHVYSSHYVAGGTYPRLDVLEAFVRLEDSHIQIGRVRMLAWERLSSGTSFVSGR